MKYEIYRSPIRRMLSFMRQWRFRVIAANHEKVAYGESYHNFKDCLSTVLKIRGKNLNHPIYRLGEDGKAIDVAVSDADFDQAS